MVDCPYAPTMQHSREMEELLTAGKGGLRGGGGGNKEARLAERAPEISWKTNKERRSIILNKW